MGLPRLVACDLDGTLVARDNRLSRPVRKAVANDSSDWSEF